MRAAAAGRGGRADAWAGRLRRLLPVLALGLVCLGGAALVAAAGKLASFERGPLAIETADGARHDFEVELALTRPQQAQGLMFRRELDEKAGMLFVYKPNQEVVMWMKNTMIPLDMLFIEADGRISRIAERTVPQSLTPIPSQGRVQGVLELNAGSAARLGIGPGDRVLHPAFGSAP